MTFVIGVLITGFGTVWQAGDNKASAARRFDEVAEKATHRVQARLGVYEYGLRGARGVVLAAGIGQLNRHTFSIYAASRDLVREFPGARGIGVIRRVPALDVQAFAAAARRAGTPGFAIRELAPNAGERDVIQYIEPVEQNAEAIGLDIASEAVRRHAAQTSIRTGVATLTAPLTLVQASGLPMRSFLLLLPIFAPEVPTGTPGEREAATVGWTFAPLVIDEVLRDFDFRDDQISVTLRDVAGADRRIFFSHDRRSGTVTELTRHIALPIYGRTWEAEVIATPGFLQSMHLRDPRLVAAVGMLFSALLAALLALYAQSTRRARQVRAEVSRRASIVESSSDAIIGETVDGIVTDWNRGAERLFGYTASFAIGRPLAGLLVPDGHEGEDTLIREAIGRGGSIPLLETVRRQQDGILLEVSITVSPIVGPNARHVGFSSTMRDIGDAKRAERRILEANANLERVVEERTQLAQSAHRDLHSILDAAPSMIGYWDRNLINRVANRAYEVWLEAPRSGIVGSHMRDALGEETFQLNLPFIEAALRGEAQTFERSLPKPNAAGVRHVLINYLPDIIEGDVRGFYVMVHDISELTESRLKLAAAVREKDALLGTLHQHAIVSVTDKAGRIIDVNDGFCRISGYTRDELLGQNHRVINSGTMDDSFFVDMWKTIAAGHPWRGDVCNRRKDGSLYWVDSIIAPSLGEDGRIEKYISIRTDITAAKLTEQRLRSSEALLDRAEMVAGIGGWEVDLRTNALTWSAQTHRIHEVDLGYEPNLHTAMEFFPPDARAVLERVVSRGIAENEGWDIELPFVTAKGNRLWVRSVGKTDIENGKAIRLVGAFQDVTARKQIAAQLAETNQRFEIASDAAGIGVWEFDVTTGVLTWDDRMFQLYGRIRSRGTDTLALWSDSLHSDDRARCEEEFADAVERLPTFETEFRIVRPDGIVRHLKAVARVLRDSNGRALRITGVNLDITARTRAELELLETSSLLRTVLESASEVSIIAADPDLLITVFNSGAERLLGYTSEEIVGRHSPVLIHDRAEVEMRGAELTRELGRVVEGGGVFIEPSTLRKPREWTYLRKDGSRVSVSLVCTAMHRDDGSLFGYLGIAHDVTRQKEVEQSLRDAIQKARDANQAKSQFLANMSHEIRTPMNAVIGLSYLLAQTGLAPQQSALLGKIKVASKSLLAVINDILDLSKIEAGELTIERVQFDLRTLLKESSDLIEVQAQERKIAYRMQIADDVPDAVVGDSTRVRQILMNLLSNAVKFTEIGGVQLDVRCLSGSADRVALRFGVQDSGIGIAPDVQSRLFAPFAQADASTTRRFGGTGLGLSIVKRLAQLMDGDVGVESTPGVGSEFWVTLTFGQASGSSIAPRQLGSVPTTAGGLHGIRVLVVDDNDVNRQVAQRILQIAGADVSLALNGQEALDKLREDPHAIDVVLMDVQMPVLDGNEATRCIRRDLGLIDLPIIALTAGALESERERSIAAGMNGFITKPFDPQALVRTIRGHLRTNARPPAGLSAEPPTSRIWPEIQGIDTNDVRQRIQGDLDLFRSLLKLFLNETYGDEIRMGSVDPASMRAQERRMHKLKGTSGALGAIEIHGLADEAEQAYRTGDVERAQQLSIELTARLEALRGNVVKALERMASTDAAALSHPVEGNVSSLDLTDLIHLLHQQNLGALDRFRTVARQLQRQMGAESFGHLQEQMDKLEFGDAARVLEDVNR